MTDALPLAVACAVVAWAVVRPAWLAVIVGVAAWMVLWSAYMEVI